MNSYVRPMLAGLLLAGMSAAAGAQTTPATRACLPGEQLVGGVCRPLTGTPDRPSTNLQQPNQQPNTTGSTSGPTTGNQNTGGSGGQGGGSPGGPSTGNQNTGGSGGQGSGSGGSSGSGG
ncbi:hypothetical protein [Microvirga arabica]|uniref:Uncharacterized protein n=1 Tax=Microvirga arabica TaxID=1128671 RepID=A0ABV6Y2J6_9HYPH|nr:hypothetical protein [Microvirga arabica]MBM1173267.1 hypothetical protein [Microvirga arabica]